MKFKIVIDCEDEEEVRIINSARANYRIVNDLYDEVFRPVIKYSEDYLLVGMYETVWEKVNEYIEERE